MPNKLTLAALLLPAALLVSTGCKSNSSNPQPSSQPSAQGASPAASSASPGNQPAGAPPSANVTAAPPPSSNVAPAPVAPPPPPVVVPAGAILRVRLVQSLGSKISQEGDHFDATLSAPVVVHGNRVIPAGTRAVGVVTEAHPAGRFKGGATLGIELTSLHLDGQVYRIHTSVTSEARKGKGKRTATMIGGGTGAGALIGGLAGGGKGALIGGLLGAGAGTAGAATGNRDVVLRSETPLSFQLTSSLTLPLGSRAPAPTRQPMAP
jgi:hypothetical protein